jgi:FlaG/FlaF family flagellin (archaellin)
MNYTGSGGEIFSVDITTDANSTYFVYENYVYFDDSVVNLANLEMDLNQVIANGDTVIYATQCDGYSKTWDYTIDGSWKHSNIPCNGERSALL